MVLSCLEGAGNQNQNQHEIIGEISISLGPLFQSSDSQVESVLISVRPVLLEKHFRGLQACSTREVLQRSPRARISEIFDCDEHLGWV